VYIYIYIYIEREREREREYLLGKYFEQILLTDIFRLSVCFRSTRPILSYTAVPLYTMMEAVYAYHMPFTPYASKQLSSVIKL
jgi:hypothetical protein